MSILIWLALSAVGLFAFYVIQYPITYALTLRIATWAKQYDGLLRSVVVSQLSISRLVLLIMWRPCGYTSGIGTGFHKHKGIPESNRSADHVCTCPSVAEPDPEAYARDMARWCLIPFLLQLLVWRGPATVIGLGVLVLIFFAKSVAWSARRVSFYALSLTGYPRLLGTVAEYLGSRIKYVQTDTETRRLLGLVAELQTAQNEQRRVLARKIALRDQLAQHIETFTKASPKTCSAQRTVLIEALRLQLTAMKDRIQTADTLLAQSTLKIKECGDAIDEVRCLRDTQALLRKAGEELGDDEATLALATGRIDAIHADASELLTQATRELCVEFALPLLEPSSMFD